MANEVFVPGTGSLAPKLVVVGAAASSVDIDVGRPFADRAGDLIRYYLTTEAGIELSDMYFTYAIKGGGTVEGDKRLLWQELKNRLPKVVLTLGKMPTQWLLKLKKSFALKSVVGHFHTVPYMTSSVLPWYDANYLLQRGGKTKHDTLDLFAQLYRRIYR